MPGPNSRLFTGHFQLLQLYQWSGNPWTGGTALADLLTVYTSVTVKADTDLVKVRAVWEKSRSYLPVEKGYEITVGAVVEDWPSLVAIYMLYGPGPFRIVYNNGGSLAFAAYCWIQTTGLTAGGEAQEQDATLLVQGDPFPI